MERHQDNIAGVISCFDRVVITGTLPDIGHAAAMAGYLGSHGVRLFDYALWAQPLRDEIRANAERLARLKPGSRLNSSANTRHSARSSG